MKLLSRPAGPGPAGQTPSHPAPGREARPTNSAAYKPYRPGVNGTQPNSQHLAMAIEQRRKQQHRLTNPKNPWQGGLRQAPVDLSLFSERPLSARPRATTTHGPQSQSESHLPRREPDWKARPTKLSLEMERRHGESASASTTSLGSVRSAPTWTSMNHHHDKTSSFDRNPDVDDVTEIDSANANIFIPPARFANLLRPKQEPAFPKRTVVRPGKRTTCWFDGPEGQVSSDEEDLFDDEAQDTSKEKTKNPQAYYTADELPSETNSRTSTASSNASSCWKSSSRGSQPSIIDANKRHHYSKVDIRNSRPMIHLETSKESVQEEHGVEEPESHYPARRRSISSFKRRSVKLELSNLNQESVLYLSSSEDDNDTEAENASIYHTPAADRTSFALSDRSSTLRRSLLRRNSTDSNFNPYLQGLGISYHPQRSSVSTANTQNSLLAPSLDDRASRASSNQSVRSVDTQQNPSDALQKLEGGPEGLLDPATAEDGDSQATARAPYWPNFTQGMDASSREKLHRLSRQDSVPYEVLVELVRHSKDAVPEPFLREIVKNFFDCPWVQSVWREEYAESAVPVSDFDAQ
ncbi:hypothetical protein KEM55_004300 [Ascosphaera atra]|nr:hypothetical protein KEM55_004300 [Ascosphaera atra]